MSTQHAKDTEMGEAANRASASDKQYQGRREGHTVTVTVDGRPLNPRFDLWNHSPTGFEWGYGGSGPTQLALALLADCLNDGDQALSLYQEFKFRIVASLPHRGWMLTSEQIRSAITEMQGPVTVMIATDKNGQTDAKE